MTDKRLIFLSDTHNQHENIEIPDGDFIIHCGDISGRGYRSEVESFLDWFSALPHKYKIMIPGNHDFLFEEDYETAKSFLERGYINCILKFKIPDNIKTIDVDEEFKKNNTACYCCSDYFNYYKVNFNYNHGNSKHWSEQQKIKKIFIEK